MGKHPSITEICHQNFCKKGEYILKNLIGRMYWCFHLLFMKSIFLFFMYKSYTSMHFLLQPMMSTSPTIFSGASIGHCLLSPPSMGTQPLHNLDLSDRRWGCRRNRVEAVLLHRLAPMHRLSSPLLIKDHETALHTIKTRVMEHLGSLAEKGDDRDTGLLDLSSMHGISTKIEGDLMAMRGSKLVQHCSALEVGILRREARPVRHWKKKAEVSNNKFSLCLTKKEIEDDFMAIRGSKPHHRPEKKRSRKIQNKLDVSSSCQAYI